MYHFEDPRPAPEKDDKAPARPDEARKPDPAKEHEDQPEPKPIITDYASL